MSKCKAWYYIKDVERAQSENPIETLSKDFDALMIERFKVYEELKRAERAKKRAFRMLSSEVLKERAKKIREKEEELNANISKYSREFEKIDFSCGVIIEQVSVALLRSKLNSLDNEKTYNRMLEILRADTNAAYPYKGRNSVFIPSFALTSEFPYSVEDMSNYSRFTNNKSIDLVNSGIVESLSYSFGRDTLSFNARGMKSKDALRVLIPSSKYFDNGRVKPIEKWRYTDSTPLNENKLAIGREIENHRGDKQKKLEVKVYGTHGERYRKANVLDIETGGRDTNIVVERYRKILALKERQVFDRVFLNGCTIPECALKLHTTEKSIRRAIDRIKVKVLKAGLAPKYEGSVLDSDGELKVYAFKDGVLAYTFDSVRQASIVLGVARTHIQNVLSGSRKSAGGYSFIRANKASRNKIVFKSSSISSEERERLIANDLLLWSISEDKRKFVEVFEDGKLTRVSADDYFLSITDDRIVKKLEMEERARKRALKHYENPLMEERARKRRPENVKDAFGDDIKRDYREKDTFFESYIKFLELAKLSKEWLNNRERASKTENESKVSNYRVFGAEEETRALKASNTHKEEREARAERAREEYRKEVDAFKEYLLSLEFEEEETKVIKSGESKKRAEEETRALKASNTHKEEREARAERAREEYRKRKEEERARKNKEFENYFKRASRK